MITTAYQAVEEWPEYRLRFLLNKSRSAEELGKLKTALEVSFVPMEAIGEQGELDVSETRPKEEVSNGYTLFFNGDILVAKITPCFENGKGAVAKGLIGGAGVGTTELYVLDPNDKLDEQFLYYVTTSEPFRKSGEASMKGAAGQKRVPDEFIQDYRLKVPPLETQRRIADYLDRETARIDALIAEKEKMLALLEEKRTALISSKVTRGLNPDTPMKPSGLDWLGDIPAHWDILPLRWFMKIGSGEFLANENISNEETEEMRIPVVGGNGVLGYTNQSNAEDALIIGRVGAQCGNVHFVNGPVWVTDNALLVSLTSRLDPIYVREVLHLLGLNTLANQSAQPLITGEVVKAQKVPAPPRQEQEQIRRFLTSAFDENIVLRDEIRKSMRLLKERRAALITAAVTGQLDLEQRAA